MRQQQALATLILAVGLLVMPARASAGPASRWFLEHLALDVAAVTAWRVAWADERNPGFNMIGGGGELHLSLIHISEPTRPY